MVRRIGLEIASPLPLTPIDARPGNIRIETAKKICIVSILDWLAGNARMKMSSLLGIACVVALAGSVRAEPLSLGIPASLPPSLPAPADVDYPGTLRIAVDATDTARRIFRVRETVPVAPGTRSLTLLYPKWLPGNHAPNGRVDDLVGLVATVNGATIGWTRDPVDTNAFHLDLPGGTREVALTFQYVSPTETDQGRVVMTPDLLNLEWNLVALYPAGYHVRRIPIAAEVTLPDGWNHGTALRPAPGGATGATVRYETVSFETLVDSPIFAGRYFRREQLSPQVALNIVADSPEELAATPDQIERHRQLVTQAVRLFGTQHYDHYDFLLAISDTLGGIGLEHHRSSENGVKTGYFTKWAEQAGRRYLLPHEFVHSWDGKYRRGEDLYTPDYAMPMRNSLLWVYEGQTQFWGYVLQARSGLVSKEETLAHYAMLAAAYDGVPGRQWRPLADTTIDPVISGRRPQPWLSWQRGEDYYNEGLLLWLEADMQIRELTGGKKSLDDFARVFFGGREGDWGVSTYRFEDVVATLNAVAPFDWAKFLDDRVNKLQPHAPLGWLGKGGYRLVFTSEPTPYWKAEEKRNRIANFTYSLGFVVDATDSSLASVLWDGPAFKAGLTTGARLLAVNGVEYDSDRLKAAITAAQGNGKPVELLFKEGDRYRTVSIPWTGGLRYPRLEKVAKGESWLDRLLAPKS